MAALAFFDSDNTEQICGHASNFLPARAPWHSQTFSLY